jgi:hypothetical protein
VLEAMDLRLRGFPTVPGRDPDAWLEFSGPDARAGPPVGTGRPVYDTPFGSLHYFSDADTLWGELAGVRLRCEPSRGIALVDSAEFAGSDLYLATHPLATISLMELLERRGRYSLHAACLADADGRGVLLAGPSGAGKSTLALALARSGMSFLSDDLVFLASRGARVRVLGFSDTIGVSNHAAERFGELRGRLGPAPAGFPKPLGRIEDLGWTPVLADCEPHALVFSEVINDQLSRIEPLDPGEALLRLVPDVLLTEPSATQAHLRAIANLLDQVSCFRLVSGADLERATSYVRELV